MLLPPDLLDDPAYAEDSNHQDMWFTLEHDTRRRTCFASCAPTRNPPPSAAIETLVKEEMP
jgi:hypothetical protein